MSKEVILPSDRVELVSVERLPEGIQFQLLLHGPKPSNTPIQLRLLLSPQHLVAVVEKLKKEIDEWEREHGQGQNG